MHLDIIWMSCFLHPFSLLILYTPLPLKYNLKFLRCFLQICLFWRCVSNIVWNCGCDKACSLDILLNIHEVGGFKHHWSSHRANLLDQSSGPAWNMVHTVHTSYKENLQSRPWIDFSLCHVCTDPLLLEIALHYISRNSKKYQRYSYWVADCIEWLFFNRQKCWLMQI